MCRPRQDYAALVSLGELRNSARALAAGWMLNPYPRGEALAIPLLSRFLCFAFVLVAEAFLFLLFGFRFIDFSTNCCIVLTARFAHLPHHLFEHFIIFECAGGALPPRLAFLLREKTLHFLKGFFQLHDALLQISEGIRHALTFLPCWFVSHRALSKHASIKLLKVNVL